MTDALEIVRDVIATYRCDGDKIHTAFDRAGDVLGTGPRWCRSVWRREPCAIRPQRRASLIQRYIAWLEVRIAEQEYRLADTKLRHATMVAGISADRTGLGERATAAAAR